jgi:hypothetical protein
LLAKALKDKDLFSTEVAATALKKYNLASYLPSSPAIKKIYPNHSPIFQQLHSNVSRKIKLFSGKTIPFVFMNKGTFAKWNYRKTVLVFYKSKALLINTLNLFWTPHQVAKVTTVPYNKEGRDKRSRACETTLLPP